MRINSSIRNYFLVMPLVLVIGGGLLWGAGSWMAHNYRDLSHHFIDDDVPLLEELSSYSFKITTAHGQSMMLLEQRWSQTSDFYSRAVDKLDQVRDVIEQVENSARQVERFGEHDEGLKAANPHRLLPPLRNYINSMADAIEIRILDPDQALHFMRQAEADYTAYHLVNSQLVVELGQEIRAEHQAELARADSVAMMLAIVAAAGSGLFLMVAFIFSGQLGRRIEVLRCALLGLGQGEVDVEIPDHFKELELQRMADALRSFRNTQQRLHSTLDELSAMKEELEQRVASRTHALAHEVEQHRQAQARLLLASQVMRSTSEAVVITDAHNCVVDVNEAYCMITGYSREEMIGSNPSLIRSGIHDEAFYQVMWQTLTQQGCWKGEIWDRRKNGEVFPKWLAINAVRDDQEQLTHYVGVFSDISELKSKEAELQALAHFDPLTRLPNRVLCKELVEQQLNNAQRTRHKVALLFIDLDHFKHVNDSLGHAAGDELLVEVSQRLERSLKDTSPAATDTGECGHTIARLGGDEFIIAIDNLSVVEGLVDLVERMQQVIRQPMMIQQKTVHVDSSIGIAIYPDDGQTFGELSRHADTAMYRAKESGRNRFVFFTEEMNRQAHQRLEMEIELRRSLEAGHFEVYYQPKISTVTSTVYGMEALIRWNHPELGLVSPLDFIQIAEDTGLIIPLGDWILQQACHYCVGLNRQQDSAIQVAVNISARQFADPQLVDKVIHALDESGLAPGQLELEVTESMVIGDIDDAIKTINRIRALGVKIAVDDFGTGYSSLSYLKRLPIDTLKIDRSFVRPLDDPAALDDRVIVEAIIRMGQQLRMQIVAEGVETSTQDLVLCRLGCDLLQGYLYSRPLGAEDFTEYLIKAGQPAESKELETAVHD